MSPPRTAAALVIGNEILSGKIQEGNALYLARELRALGVELRRIVVVPDEIDTIVEALDALRTTHDVVFTSGGVGPTHDDLTIEAVAKTFGRRVVREPSIAELIAQHYGDRCTDGHLRMADVPEGAELVTTDRIRWPTVAVENVYVLPGIPEIFRLKFEVVKERFRSEPFQLREIWTTLDEGDLKPLLDSVVAAHPAVQIGSYPRIADPEYRVKLTFDGKDARAVGRAADAMAEKIPASAIVRRS